MHHFLWFVHILGVVLWLGVSAGLLIVWPSCASLRASLEEPSNRRLDLRTLITLHTRTGHIGAGLTAVAGVTLSFMEQPKSELGTLWLTSMQGLGAVAFIISVIIVARTGKRIVLADESAAIIAAAGHFRLWLTLTVLLLLICLLMAAFKPMLYI